MILTCSPGFPDVTLTPAFCAAFPSAEGILPYLGAFFYGTCINLITWVFFALLPHVAEIG